MLRRRCSRQRELANPAIRKGRLNVKKKHLHIRPLSIAGFEVFVTAFSFFLQRFFFAIYGKNLLLQLSIIFVYILLCPYWIRPWHLLRVKLNKKRLVYRSSGNIRYLVIHRLSKKSFVGFHMARDKGLFILDWRQFYRPKNGSVRLDQSE